MSVTILLIVTVPSAQAAIIFDASDAAGTSPKILTTYGTGLVLDSRDGGNFTLAADSNIQQIMVGIYKVGSVTGTVSVSIYGTEGGLPDNDNIIEVSSTVLDLSTMANYPADMYHVFNFGGTIRYSAGVQYAVVVTGLTGNYSDGSHYVGTSAGTKAGYYTFHSYDSTKTWATFQAGQTVDMVIYGTTAAATPTPSPVYQYWNGTAWVSVPGGTASPAPTEQQLGMTNWGRLVLGLIVTLAIAFLCAYAAGAWGFFAGLNVGVFLCYGVFGVTVMPLFAVLAIIVLDVALIVGKIGLGRFGGGGHD